MGKYKDFRKSLKQPDQFQTTVVSGMERVLRFKGFIIAAIAAVVVGVIGLAAYQHIQADRTAERVNELGKIEEAYTKENEALNDQRNKLREEIAAMTKMGPDGSPAKLTPAEEKKRDALQAKLAALTPDHSGTVNQYEEFYKKYKSYPEGWMAGMRAAGIMVDEKEYAKAKELLGEILAATDDSFFYQINGRMLYINVLDELNEIDTALAEVDKLSAEIARIDRMSKEANEARRSDRMPEVGNPAEQLAPQVLFTKGRLLLRKDDKKAAQASFDEILKKYKDSSEAHQVKSYKALLL